MKSDGRKNTGFLCVFYQEIRYLASSPKSLFLILAAPLFLFAFFVFLLQDGLPHKLPVAFLDHDQTVRSRQLVRMLDNCPYIRLTARYSGLPEIKRAMQHGDIYAYIDIPVNFQRNLYKGLPNTVVCYTNSQFITPAGLIQKNFATAVGTFSAGVNLSKRTQSGEQPDRALVSIQPVVIDQHLLFNPFINYGYYLLPAFLPMMFQMLIMVITIYALGRSLKEGTGLQWYAQSGENAWAALWGKMLPYTVIFLFWGWWMNYLVFTVLKTPIRVPLSSLTLFTCFIVLVYQLLAVCYVGISRNLTTALTLGGGYAALAFSFAGYTFPTEGLPRSMQIIGEVFPFTHYMRFYINRAIRGVSTPDALHSVWALCAYLVFFLLVFPLFVKRLKKGRYDEEF